MRFVPVFDLTRFDYRRVLRGHAKHLSDAEAVELFNIWFGDESVRRRGEQRDLIRHAKNRARTRLVIIAAW